MKYFEVETKCGHVGRNNCVLVKFPIEAKNGKEAAAKARQIPRVKHHHKDAIRYVKEITYEDYKILHAQNDVDEYLHCKSKKEQKQIDILDRVIVDELNVDKEENEKKKKYDAVYRNLRKKIKEEYYKTMIDDYFLYAI